MLTEKRTPVVLSSWEYSLYYLQNWSSLCCLPLKTILSIFPLLKRQLLYSCVAQSIKIGKGNPVTAGIQQLQRKKKIPLSYQKNPNPVIKIRLYLTTEKVPDLQSLLSWYISVNYFKSLRLPDVVLTLLGRTLVMLIYTCMIQPTGKNKLAVV